MDATLENLSQERMFAAYSGRYGDPTNLQIREVLKRRPGKGEVRVRVQNAALHIGDSFTVRGDPFAMRMVSGWLRPKWGIPGFDLAGTVDSVGVGVLDFAPGDPVFGASIGTCAEYAIASATELARKPSSISFEQAAALPTSALAALHALRDTGRIQAGQRVLVNGAAGGVGHYAIQLASHFGAEVTGVCGTKNVEFVRSIGADHVIDYTQRDFCAGKEEYDLILDNVENRPLAECRRALTPTGTLILNSGTGASGMAMVVRLLKPLLLSPFVKQRLCRYLSKANTRDLEYLGQLTEAEIITPVIEKKYPIHETAAALQHIETGHARGKVTISI